MSTAVSEPVRTEAPADGGDQLPPGPPGPPHAHPVAVALDAVGAALAAVSETPLWSLTPAEAAGLVDRATRTVAMCEELRLRLVAAADGGGVAEHHAATSTAAWLACSTGALGVEQARVVATALDRLPSAVGSELLARAQEWMIERAQRFDAVALTRLGRHLVEVIDPDGADAELARQLAQQERAAEESCWLTLAEHDGQTRGRFVIPTVVAGAQLRRLLEALSAPRRRPGQPEQQVPDERDSWSYPRRLGEAFCELVNMAAKAKPPLHGGSPATLVVTVDADRLDNGTGVGVADDGTELSAETVQRLACAATIVSMLLDRQGVPLRMGRSARLFTPAQRLALAVRDRHCAFPNCDRPPGWCEAHHITPWQSGGTTDLDNAVLLCGYHHRVVHAGGWAVVMGEDGRPRFVPPAWLDPARTPRSNPIAPAFHRRE